MEMNRRISLQLLDGRYAISRLAAAAAFPRWAEGAGFVSISRSDEELSIVCREDRVPEEAESDRNWVCLKFLGSFALYETGIVLSVVQPLSEGGIGVFVVSTYNGDHLLIKNDDLLHAQMLLQNAGHTLE
jgi:uncharacterized protein